MSVPLTAVLLPYRCPQIVFVSADRTASSFAAHVAEQPAAWAALPFERRRTKVRDRTADTAPVRRRVAADRTRIQLHCNGL